MKKKIATKQTNENKNHSLDPLIRTSTKPALFKISFQSLFHLNYQILTKTINQTMSKPSFSSIINSIFFGQPSIQLISFQQIQKNLVHKQYLQKYHRFDQIPEKMKSLVPKHLPNVKVNYMDFKIQNFLILNKYKITQKVNLPYPLCTKFQKLTDSKMSSTKSVENKVLHELQKQLRSKKSPKSPQLQSKSLKDSNDKKNFKTSQINTERFEIKYLTKGIGEMIQNIKDVRALQNFKKEMEKSTQFKFTMGNFSEKESKIQKKIEKKQILKLPKQSHELNELKEREFRRKLENEMGNFRISDKRQQNLIKRMKSELNLGIEPKKQQKVNRFHFKSTQRLKTDIGPQIQQYGLSVIREKRKKSKSHQKNSKSKSHTKSNSKLSSHKIQLNLNKRLQTEYSSGSTQRLNTGHSLLNQSKPTSRIPTEYDSTVIRRMDKSRSKGKHKQPLFSDKNKNKSKSKNESKSSSIASRTALGFKKSKSKSKLNFLQFSTAINKESKK